MRRALLFFLIACRAPAPAPSAPLPAIPIEGVEASAPDTASSDDGILIEKGEGTRLPDGPLVIGRDNCFEVQPSHDCTTLERGEVEVLEKWLVYRDRDNRYRARPLSTHTVSFQSERATLNLGDKATVADFTIQWTGITLAAAKETVIELTVSHPGWLQPKVEHLALKRPSAQLTNPKSFLKVDLGLEEIKGDAMAIVLSASIGDTSTKANFGTPLGDGIYVFPDGLRISYRYNRDCEYDPSVPCIWRHQISASFERADKSLELTARGKPTATALGHTFAVVNDRLVVKK